MAFCEKCGTQLNDGANFCPSCGAQKEEAAPAQQTTPPQVTDFVSTVQNLNNTKDSTAEFDQSDIEQNKILALFAYIGILFLVPLLGAKDSKYARFHANQGLLLFVAEIAYSVAYFVVSAIILMIAPFLFFLPAILGLVNLVFLAAAILGIVNAVTGKAKELPLIGTFRIIK